MKSMSSRNRDLSVNYHLIKACNASCTYCFANFPNLTKHDRLSDADQERLIDLLVDNDVGQINFAGGEPTLVPGLGALCERIKKRSRGNCAVSVVSNGWHLRELIEGWRQWTDWVALSLDSGDDQVHVSLGRTRKDVPYTSHMLALGEVLRNHGVQVKCNTVVTKHNVDEDMSAVIRRLAPERWKLFQVLPVIGENDRTINDLVITKGEFRAFVERHRPLRDEGVEIVPEDNTLMTNSYLMISPDGRFFWHTPRGESRGLEDGNPILEVGWEEALRQVRFSKMKFLARGGMYDWHRPGGDRHPRDAT